MHSLLSIQRYLTQTSVLSCSTRISLASKALFTLFHLICGLSLNLTHLTLDLFNLFTNRSSSILSTCPYHCRTFPPLVNEHNTSSVHLLTSHSIHTSYSTHTPETLHLHYIQFHALCSTHIPCFRMVQVSVVLVAVMLQVSGQNTLMHHVLG